MSDLKHDAHKLTAFGLISIPHWQHRITAKLLVKSAILLCFLVSPVKVEEPRRVPGTGTDEMLIYDTIKAKAISTGTIL